MIKFLTILILACFFVSGVAGPSWGEDQMFLSATEQVKRLADFERNEQLKRGVIGTVLGGVYLQYGIPMLAPGSPGALPGMIFAGAGIFFLYVGLDGFFFAPATIKEDYNRMKELKVEEQENAAARYLEKKAIESEEKQQDNLFNFFGLFPKPETQERKIYKEYLDQFIKTKASILEEKFTDETH